MVVGRQAVEDPRPRLPVDAELGEQLAVEVRVAEPDHRARQAGRVERGGQHLDHLGGALGSGRADQLDARLGELAHLAPLRANRPVGARQVAEPERGLGPGVAVGDEAGDRHGHVRAHREQLPRLVEEAIGDRGAALVTAGQHLLVLDRRRRHLAVAEALERVDQGELSVRNSRISSGRMSRVPGGIGWVMDITPPKCVRFASAFGGPASGGTADLADAYAGTGSDATRSILRAQVPQALVDPLVAAVDLHALPISETPSAQSAAMSIAIPARMSGLSTRSP